MTLKISRSSIARLQRRARPCSHANPEPPARQNPSSHRRRGGGERASRPSLAEVYRSVPVGGRSKWRKILAFAGPGYLVAVGYMDPGNWATDLAGGSRFGYTLLSVILMSNLMAVLLQGLASQARHRDRTRSRAGLPRSLQHAGGVVALDPVRDRHRRLRPGRGDRIGDRAQPAVRYPAARRRRRSPRSTSCSLLYLQNKGVRLLEALVITLVATVGICFALRAVPRPSRHGRRS